MRKVFYIIDTLEIGGAEKSLLEITSKIKEFNVVVCSLYIGDALKDNFEKSGVRLIRLNVKEKFGYIRTVKKVLSIVKQEKPDLIVSSLFRSEIISRTVSFITRIPQIGSFVSDSYSNDKKSTLSWNVRIKFFIFYLINLLTARISRKFIANSESVRISNCKALFLNKNKVCVIHRGRDPKRFDLEKKLSNKIRFVIISRLVSGKGHNELLTAFSQIAKENSDVTLTIAGNGPLFDIINKRIHELNLAKQVFLLGHVDDVPNLFANHDCLVFPSHFEGFSGVIVEAMFAKTPILCSNIPMNLEAVQHFKSAYVFNVKSVSSIHEALIWFINNRDLANQFAREALKTAHEKFSINNVVEKHISVYKEVLHENTSISYK